MKKMGLILSLIAVFFTLESTPLLASGNESGGGGQSSSSASEEVSSDREEKRGALKERLSKKAKKHNSECDSSKEECDKKSDSDVGSTKED